MTATMQYLRGDWDGALRTLDTTGAAADDDRPTRCFRSTAMPVRAGRGEVDGVDDPRRAAPVLAARGPRRALRRASAALEIYEQQADVAGRAGASSTNSSRRSAQLWLDPWFLARIQLSALGLAVLCAAAAARAARPSTSSSPPTAAGCSPTAAPAPTRGCPRGRALGREGQAWLARLEAEGRPAALAHRPGRAQRRRAGRRLAQRRSTRSTTARSCSSTRSRTGWPRRCGPPAGPTRPPSRPSWRAPPATAMRAAPLLDELRALGHHGRRPRRRRAVAA